MGVNLGDSVDRNTNLTEKEKIILLKSGSISATSFENIVISSEVTETGKVLFHVSSNGKELFSTWLVEPREESKPHRGSKKSYSMLMKKEFKELLKNHNPTLEEKGAVTELATLYVDWGTGLLCHRKKPLKFEQLCNIFGCKKTKTTQLIKSLKDKNILEHKQDGYYLSRTFIKKGGAT